MQARPGCVATSLLALLAANGTWVLDCVCQTAADDAARQHPASYGEWEIRSTYCRYQWNYDVMERCENLDPPSAVVAALLRLLPLRSLEPPPPDGGGECHGGLPAVRGLTEHSAMALTRDLGCLVAADCTQSCPLPGLDDMEWNETALAADHVRRPVLSQLLRAVRDITKALTTRGQLVYTYNYHYLLYNKFTNLTEYETEMQIFLQRLHSHWRDSAELLSLGVAHLSKLLLPLAFEHVGNYTNAQELHVWFGHMERLRDMLCTKLMGWIQDVQSVSEQIVNYKVETDKNRRRKYQYRRPLLNDELLVFQSRFLSFREDFSAACSRHQPHAAAMLGLADALHSFYHSSWFTTLRYDPPFANLAVDEKWRLDVSTNTTLSVDTGCLQLLANALDHPRCPLERLPPEALKRREQCRAQLWGDLVDRLPHIPVTSYLAYTQRTTVNLYLLAWMAANSFGICQDVPFSVIQSVHDARCYFDNLDDRSCPELNATHAICSVSRAILSVRRQKFFTTRPVKVCRIVFEQNGSYSKDNTSDWVRDKPSEKILNFKDTLNSFTLKYKDFTIDSLKPLEFSFITMNILFRFLTAGVYTCIPQLRNLPGKILLTYQMTGIVQILCSEVVYRVARFPDLSAMVLIDSALTLLSCLWLNTFCYQMYACVRHLRLPNHLSPAEASREFRRLVLCALIPWTLLCAATVALENTSKYYLLHSRILSIVGISVSVAVNFVFLGLVGCMYLRTKNSMQELQVINNDKFCSKTQLIYLSVKAVVLSGTGTIIRIGFHQAQGIAQIVYCVHIATMVQGPLLFVLFVCNSTTLPVLKKRLLACWNGDVITPGQDLPSSAERNLAKRTNDQTVVAESSL